MTTGHKSLLSIILIVLIIKVITTDVIIVDDSISIVVVVSVRNHKLAILLIFQQVCGFGPFVVLVSVVVGGAKEGCKVLRA